MLSPFHSGRPDASPEDGQAMVEWGGVLLVVALLIAAVMAVGIPGQIAANVQQAVASVFGPVSAASGSPHSAGTTPPGPYYLAAAAGKPAPKPQPGSGRPAPNPQPGSGQPAPNPQPGPSPQWRWPASAGNHADQLPTGGQRPYSPPKSGRGNPVRVKGGGYVDQNGNRWEWAPPGQQHGGPHWDVQHPDGSHTNVAPDGTVIGKDNFPNKSKAPTPPPPPPPSGSSDGNGNTAKAVAVTAGAAGAAGVAWWLGKLASPACGPAVVVCAIVF